MKLLVYYYIIVSTTTCFYTYSIARALVVLCPDSHMHPSKRGSVGGGSRGGGGGVVGLQAPQSTRQPTQNQDKQQRSAGSRHCTRVQAREESASAALTLVSRGNFS